HGVAARLDRAENIAAKNKPVVHGDWHVPIDAHAVTNFADLAIAHLSTLLGSGWDDRQQKMCLPGGADMQRDLAAKNFGRPVARVVMGEGPDAGPNLAERLDAFAGLTGINIVVAAHGEREAMTLGQRDAGGPDLDVDLVDFTGRERLLLVMGVV